MATLGAHHERSLARAKAISFSFLSVDVAPPNGEVLPNFFFGEEQVLPFRKIGLFVFRKKVCSKKNTGVQKG